MAEVAVVGTGYVGLTTGAYLSHLGHNVVCADVVAEKVEALNEGRVPIHEVGLDELVRTGLDTGRLRFVLGAQTAVTDAEFVFLCLPTPQGEDGSADLSYVESVASEIGPHLLADAVVVNKSTVPVGSTRRVAALLGRDDVHVVSNPEFLREGQAVHDSLHPDRIVIGAYDNEVALRLAALYAELQAQVLVTDPASAETIKYVANAYLATKVSFVNAVARFCELVGADVTDVALGMGQDKRIGFEFLKPGPGWGGSCFEGGESVLACRDGVTRLMTFADLFAEVESAGASGWEVLAWDQGEPTPVFRRVTAFTARPYEGDLLTVRTKMGRRVRCTPDHPFVVTNATGDSPRVVTAGELTSADWLPVSQGAPLRLDAGPPAVLRMADAVTAAAIDPRRVHVRMDEAQLALLDRIPTEDGRRAAVRRSGTARLSDLRSWGIPDGGSWGTATNGTYVPALIPVDEELWYILGLFLAEGHITTDGRRQRIQWSFHPTAEEELVEAVSGWLTALGCKHDVRSRATTRSVSVSSVLLATLFESVLGLGRNCYSKAVPDLLWAAGDLSKWALLRGAWDGDGSWSLVNGGPSSILEYGTVSPRLADGMLRLLADVGVVAALRVGRTGKSTCDTYWLRVSGAAQIEEARWLLPPVERNLIMASMAGQAKRILPTGYRRHEDKAVAWVRVVSTDRAHWSGTVFSLEVDEAHTVVTSGGLVAHNCFPKDTRALIRMAEVLGYDFHVLRSVVKVNDEQYDRVAEKIAAAAGGSLAGQTVAAWGLTFKARTDDLRESPALFVIERLLAQGATVRAFDPMVTRARRHHGVRGRVRRDRGRRRARRAHRVGGVPIGRPRQGARRHERTRDRGRPEPARPRARAPKRVHLRRDRPAVRVVVTGGAGFIGSHLCRALLARGDAVVAIDNLLTGRIHNIEELFGQPGFSFVHHDVSNFVHVSGEVDAVLHFASPASPADFERIPIQILKVGSLGTHHMLGLAKDKGARFFLASTSEVYGDPQVHPQPETYWGHVNPDRPQGRLRRSQALRRGDDDGVPPRPRPRRAHRAHLQLLRRANASRRRARGVQLLVPGDSRPADHGLWRWKPDAQLLLRRGRDPRVSRAARQRLRRTGEHRQSRRAHRAAAGRDGDRGRQQQFRDRVRAAPGRRSRAASARHLAGPFGARVGTGRPAERRPDPHGGVLPYRPRRRGRVTLGTDVAVVVVNYNAGDHVVACVESFRAAGVDRIVVADNGSTDGSLALLRAADPDTTVIETGANLGYGGGVNRAAREVVDASVLIVSNPDVVVAPDTVAILSSAIEADPTLGVVGPRIDNTDGTLYPSARTFPNLFDAAGHAFLGTVAPNNRFTRNYRLLDWDHSTSKRVDWVSGACFAIRGDLFRRLHGFDHRYFMYLEDVDLCRRVADAGYEVAYEPAARVLHVQGVSADQLPYRMLVEHHRSILRWWWATSGTWGRLGAPLVALGLAVRLLLAAATRLLGKGR